MAKKIMVSFTLEEGLKKELDALAVKMEMSFSKLMRKAAQEVLGGQNEKVG